MKKQSSIASCIFAFALLTTADHAQAPPPPPAGGPPPPPAGAPPPPPPGPGPAGPQAVTGAPMTEAGAVRYVIYGPQGELQALILRNDRIVTVPPELGAQMRGNLVQGTFVSVTGVPQYFGRQRQVTAQSMQVNGQNFVSSVPVGPGPGPQPPPPGAPPPPAGRDQPVPPPPPQ